MTIDVLRCTAELARGLNACIHQRRRSGDRIPGPADAGQVDTYPAPIVDHAKARHALAACEMSQ
jgi:hypothetical protein